MAGLLMTRPLEQSQRFVASLPPHTAAGLQVIHAPLIAITPVPGALQLDGISAVIFTSGNGVAAASARSAARLPAFCVGSRTTERAQDAGWDARFAGSDADALVAELANLRPGGRLLHLRGRHARGGIAARLTAAGLPCAEQVIYDQPLLAFDSAARKAVAAQSDVIVPLFSPRVARHFASLCPEAAHFHLIALSHAVAEPLKSLNCKDLQICRSPDAQSMTAAVSDAAARLARVEGSPTAK